MEGTFNLWSRLSQLLAPGGRRGEGHGTEAHFLSAWRVLSTEFFVPVTKTSQNHYADTVTVHCVKR